MPGSWLSPGEERGVAILDELLEAMYGPDYPPFGNGTYREPDQQTPPGEVTHGNPPADLQTRRARDRATRSVARLRSPQSRARRRARAQHRQTRAAALARNQKGR